MNEDIPRSIRFPKTLWEAIDADAQRCKRSAVKQMEAVLTAYYKLEEVEINRTQLEFVGELLAVGGKKTQVIESEKPSRKNKRSA